MRLIGAHGGCAWVKPVHCGCGFKCTKKRVRERKRNDTKKGARTNLDLGVLIFVVKTNENPRSGIALLCGTAGCVVLVTKMPHEGWQGAGRRRFWRRKSHSSVTSTATCFGYLVDPASGICLSQGLSHASVSISNFTTKLRMAR
jgi:hypothetical protein